MIFKKVLQPNRWILLCMPPISFAALIFIFEIQNTKSTLAYLVYCMSAYSLIIWISALPKMIKRMKSDIRNSKIMQKATASKIMGRYLTDTAFRGSINIYQGMTVNLSILGLQTAMISRFSENGEAYRKMMNTITGGFVYGIVIVIAITMLLHSKKSQKKVESIE